MGVEYEHDYGVAFADCQNLQLLHQKLLRTSVILDSCLDTMRACENHFAHLTSLKREPVFEEGIAEVKAYASQIEHCRRTISRILQQSLGTNHLVCPLIT